MAAGCDGDFQRALAKYEQVAERWPTDVVAAKLAEFHFFETGEAERQLRFMASIEAANRDQPHMLAMYAFAMELNGLRTQAEEVSQACAIDRSEYDVGAALPRARLLRRFPD